MDDPGVPIQEDVQTVEDGVGQLHEGSTDGEGEEAGVWMDGGDGRAGVDLGIAASPLLQYSGHQQEAEQVGVRDQLVLQAID